MPPTRTLPRALLATAAITVLVAATGACSTEPERSVANYCAQAETLRTLDEDLASGDPVRIDARATDLRLLLEVAPTEIEPSVAVLVDVTDDFATTAGTATDREDVAKVVFRGRSGDLEAIEAAGTAVSDYTRANCDVDLGSGGSMPTSTTTPGTGDPPTDAGDPTTSTTSTTSTSSDPALPSTTTTSTPSLLVD